MEKGIQTPMAQGRSTEIISMIERTAGGDRGADGMARGAGSIHHLENSLLCERESYTHRERASLCVREVDVRLSGKWEFKLPWRKAGLLKSS